MNLVDRLNHLVAEGRVAAEVRQEVLATVERMRHLYDNMMLTSVCVGPNEEVLVTWDAGEHHAELEFCPGEAPFFYYRNRVTGESHGMGTPE